MKLVALAVLVASLAASSCTDPPRTLAETGLYTDLAAGTLAPGVVPYRPRFELWSDGADKQRWLYLPPGTQIDTADLDGWIYPTGTKAWKEFRRDGVRIETRMLEKLGPDDWDMVAFAWSADGREALSISSGRRDALGTGHDIPSEEDCRSCHRVIDRLLGVTAVQLDHDLGDLDLDQLVASGRITRAPDARLDLPGDDVAQAALGTLHANCGSCHNDLAELSPLRLWLRVGELDTVEGTATYRTSVNVETSTDPLPGTDATVIVAPGDPTASLLHLRMTRRGEGAMPPLGSNRIDEAGSQLVATWIESLNL